jgi:hypothetical protein
VMHGVIGLHLVDQPDFHPGTDPEPPVDSRASAPPVRSRNRQYMVALVVRRLTSTMSSSHSTPSAAPTAAPWAS